MMTFNRLAGTLRRASLACLCLLVMSACTNLETIRADSENRATFTVEDRTYDEIWDAAVSAIEESLTLVSSDKPSGVIKAVSSADVATLSFGEVVAVYIYSMDEKNIRYWVGVVSEGRFQPSVLARSWHVQISAAIRNNLGN